VATVSASNRKHLEALLGGRGRLEVVPNSVDLRRLGPPRREPPVPGLVVSVARLVEKKGLPTLIEACALVRGHGLRLAIVGDGPLRGRLEQTAARVGAPVELLGALPNEQVLELLRRAAVFCLPCVIAPTGDRDGLPSSVLEAMALGVPVVTTAVNGLGEAVVDERTGLLVPEHDPAALAAAIERLLSDPALADRLAAEARRHVDRRFSLERSASRLRELFPEPA
jgi:glycosyltransferase involved in cell wall biosynthesis